MWWRTKTCLLLLICSFSLVGKAQKQQLSPVLKGKIDKALTAIYQKEDLQLQAVELKEEVAVETQQKLKGHFFEVKDKGELKGYAFVAQAPSMKNVFDYIVVFNTDLILEKAKVLIYREQHGRQIGTVRWLSQFKGMDVADRPELGKEVDGISGATISAKSMTNAVHDLLVALEDVKSKGFL